MGGEYRANDGTREKVLQPGTGNVRITSASKRVGHGAFARSGSGQRVGSCPADVMLVFGDVGELRKVAESANDLDVLTMREAIQCRLELVPRGFIFFAVEADRGPADVLNDREDRLAFLAAHRIAKNAAEQTDIVTQRQVLVGSFERIHDHTNSNDAAAEAASNSTTAIGAGFPRRSRAPTILAVVRQTDQPAYRCDSRDIPAARWLGRARSSAGSQRAVQVERSADQCKVRESLREVSQGLAAMPGLFRIEAEMVGETEHPLENQSRFLEPRPVVATGSGQRLDQPKRADVEGAFLSR